MASHSFNRPSLVFTCVTFLLVFSYSTAQHNQIPNVGHHYPVHIGAEEHIVQGRVSSDAEPGDLVPSNVIQEGDEEADTTVHLRVAVRDSIYKRPHVFHPNNQDNSSVIELFPNSSLPFGVQFVVIHTNAFYVNEDRYITVNDFSNLNGETRIHFDVILKDNLAETKYVSNQLHFVVEIDYPKRELNPNAVLFAGVLVLTIVSISLLIPFVVRAKRRCKAGKPIFRCGSADDASDIESLGSMPEHLKNRANSIGGKDNLAMILDNGRMKHPRHSVDRHTTIQNHMLRSTSGFQFQPHCMDPHYNDVYERPDFSRFTTQLSAQSSGAAFAHGGSRRSSVNSDTIYPENCNRDLSTNVTNLADIASSGTRKTNDVPRKANDVPRKANDASWKAWKANDVSRKTNVVQAEHDGLYTPLAQSQASNNCSAAMSNTEVQIMNGARTKGGATSDTPPSILNAHL